MCYKKVFFWFLFLLSMESVAWDSVESEKIGLIEVESGLEYSFRVWLEGTPALCGNTNQWAYIGNNNPNYHAYLSVLLAAKMANKEVTIFANRGSADNCQIGHVHLK